MSSEMKAVRLLELHHADAPVVLVNAWDVASARMVEDAGFPAIATTSAGVANALGYPDGQKIPWREMLHQIAMISSAVQAPVTADIESGFAADEQALDQRISEVIKAGAVGVNLEDLVPEGEGHGSLFSVAGQVQRIKTARAPARNLAFTW